MMDALPELKEPAGAAEVPGTRCRNGPLTPQELQTLDAAHPPPSRY
jgi:hypothetical protein